MLVQWTTLRPSLRAQRWRQVALVIAAASSIALAAAAAASKPFDFGLAVLALIAAVAVCIAMRMPAARTFEVAVAADGRLRLREREAEDSVASMPTDRPIRVAFAAPWLISARHGTTLISIWPDSLPHSVFRQLWVHLRWGRSVQNGEDQQPSEGRSGGR